MRHQNDATERRKCGEQLVARACGEIARDRFSSRRCRDWPSLSAGLRDITLRGEGHLGSNDETGLEPDDLFILRQALRSFARLCRRRATRCRDLPGPRLVAKLLLGVVRLDLTHRFGVDQGVRGRSLAGTFRAGRPQAVLDFRILDHPVDRRVVASALPRRQFDDSRSLRGRAAHVTPPGAKDRSATPGD